MVESCIPRIVLMNQYDTSASSKADYNNKFLSKKIKFECKWSKIKILSTFKSPPLLPNAA